MEDKEGDTPDRFEKIRQKRFAELFVPEQYLSHDKAMIKYFGKSGLKQAIRNKPIQGLGAVHCLWLHDCV